MFKAGAGITGLKGGRGTQGASVSHIQESSGVTTVYQNYPVQSFCFCPDPRVPADSQVPQDVLAQQALL